MLGPRCAVDMTVIAAGSIIHLFLQLINRRGIWSLNSPALAIREGSSAENLWGTP